MWDILNKEVKRTDNTELMIMGEEGKNSGHISLCSETWTPV